MNDLVRLPHGLPVADGHVIPWGELETGIYQLTAAVDGKAHVAYARVGSNDEVDNGDTLQQQVELALELARQKGHQLSAVYVDRRRGVKKLRVRGPHAVNQLITDIQNKRISTLYVYKRDRVTRSTTEWVSMLLPCLRNEVDILFTCAGEPPIPTGSAPFREPIDDNILICAEVTEGLLAPGVVGPGKNESQH